MENKTKNINYFAVTAEVAEQWVNKNCTNICPFLKSGVTVSLPLFPGTDNIHFPAFKDTKFDLPALWGKLAGNSDSILTF